MFETIKNKWQSISERKRQLGRALLVILMVVILACIISYFRSDDKKLYDKKETKIDFSDITGKGKIEDTWLELSESQLDDLKNQLAEEKKDKEELKKQLEELSVAIKESEEKNQQQFQSQIEELRKESNNKSNQNNDHNQSGGKPRLTRSNDQSSSNNNSVINDPFARVGNDFADANDNQESDQAFNENRQIDLINFSNAEEKNSFTLDNYLPSGSYVKAVLISSVDASVGITSGSDPRPVLFRIIGEARSAVDKNKQLTINIKGCTVTGAAHGDLSSERAYTRLLKMTCPDNNGGVIETDVEGYAADGSDGKSGIAGKMVSREGDLIAKSFFASFISGFGQSFSQKFTPPLTASNGLTTQGVLSGGDIAKSGLGKGVAGGTDRLSNYLIDRAEQYQPIISIASGKEVELVFISGTYLDGRKASLKSEVKSQTAASKSQLSTNSNYNL
jgi:conjugal transfer pilus assembly protein TraB